MNALQLKTLLLSVITEIKFGQPLAPNAIHIKKQFKALVGLPKNASNQRVVQEIKRTYYENKLADDYDRIAKKFGIA